MRQRKQTIHMPTNTDQHSVLDINNGIAHILTDSDTVQIIYNK